jgi:NADP-dependent 3-hydroxy acid dehydrogenase YdfG
LAREGCRVGITGRRQSLLEETASFWEGAPPILYRPTDVGDRAGVRKLFAWAEKELGPIHILVNSAGINVRSRSMAELDPEDWDDLLRVNATGAFNCIREVLPQMRQRRDGLIVNICSLSGKRALPLGGVAYNASKFAMSALGTTVRLEEAAHGIRVSNVFPGEINTPILAQRPTAVSEEHKARMLQPEDIAEVVVLLATLPPRVSIPELIIKPTTQEYA